MMADQNEIMHLIAELENADFLACLNVQRELAQIGEAAVEPLVNGLKASRSVRCRSIIIGTLDRIGGPQVAAVLLGLRTEPITALRMTAAKALVKNARADLVQDLIDWLNDEPEAVVQMWLVFALGRLGGAQAVDALVDILIRTTSATVRGMAIRALGETGDRRATWAVLQYRSDADHHVRQDARNALTKLGYVNGEQLNG